MSLQGYFRKLPFPWLIALTLAVPLLALVVLFIKTTCLSTAISQAVGDPESLGRLMGQMASFLNLTALVLLVVAAALIVSGVIHIQREIRYARAASIRRLSHDRYRFLADGPPTIGIIRIDLSDFRLEDANRAALTLLGLPRAELIGKSVMDLVSPESREEILAELEKIRDGKANCEVIVTMEDARKGIKNVAWHISSIILPDEEPAAVAVILDVTERVKAEEERLEKERLAGVLEMAGGTAHELNQPLQVVSGLVWMMLQKTSKEDPNYKKLQTISEEVERLSRLGQKIASISSYEVKSYVGDTKIIDIDRAAKERRNTSRNTSTKAPFEPSSGTKTPRSRTGMHGSKKTA